MDLPDKTTPVKRVPKEALIPKGAAKVSPRPAGRRLLDHLFAESPKAMLAKVAADVLLPRAKDGVEAAFNSFIHGMLHGAGNGVASTGIVRGSVISRGGVVVNPTDYASISNPAVQAAQASGNYSGPYRDLTVANTDVAEMLLASLISDINQYRMTTVADLYEAAAITPEDHHSTMGWYDVSTARIVKQADGVKLMLPRPVRVN